MHKRRTVIFGGSFNPVHIGHTSLAREVVERGLGDEVWFMVTPQNPHKQDKELIDETIRLQMVRLAIDGESRFKACDFEFTLPRPSYTIHTLNALEKEFPDRRFILLVGADNWAKFDRWYSYEEILSRYSLIVYPRDCDAAPLLPANVRWLSSELYDISSTMVRNMIAEGKDFSKYVSPLVFEFINENNLYRI